MQRNSLTTIIKCIAGIFIRYKRISKYFDNIRLFIHEEMKP